MTALITPIHTNRPPDRTELLTESKNRFAFEAAVLDDESTADQLGPTLLAWVEHFWRVSEQMAVQSDRPLAQYGEVYMAATLRTQQALARNSAERG